ncbi:hypothetical protein RAZWK3B_14878 [Roseobacter sp. AzwK-3b]|nr:hypothetical protein RAZWK3B_14878 [Roseobacter sp. AzwK-3b]
MSDNEVLERVQKLQKSFAELKDAMVTIIRRRPSLFQNHEIWPQIIEIEIALSHDSFFKLANDDVEARLLRSHDGFKTIRSQLESILQKEADWIDPTLSRLTKEEIKILADTTSEDLGEDGDFGTYSKDHLYLIALLTGLIDLSDVLSSEARYVLTGRFAPSEGPGRPTALRGQRLTVFLLGIAESLGADEKMNLRLSRKTNSPRRSAADAVAEALARCMDVKNPVSRAILEEAPKTYNVIVRRLIGEIKKSEILLKDRELGQRFARRLEGRT